MNEKPKILISSCLLGMKVRHDGGHCSNRTVNELFSRFIEFVPICPEQFIGLGTPRPAMHLRISNGDMCLVDKEGRNYKEEQQRLKNIHDSIPVEQICGAILKKNSPSCALDRITYTDDEGRFLGKTDGVYAKLLKKSLDIPLIDDGRLHSEVLVENFFVQVFALNEFNQSVLTYKDLQKFHKKHKFLLYQYNQHKMRVLGHMAADVTRETFTSMKKEYISVFSDVLRGGVTRENRINAFYHIFGFFKSVLTSGEKRFIIQQFELYRKNIVHFMAVLKQLEFLAFKYKISYLTEQSFFIPFPEDLRIAC
ncbi:MAG: DUF523 and DUF1722 domain-containing protein [Halobacteriovoraceae bacterium]|nr:DUF523 and DUF1722 domain-containing protein [Halobacteriovoraceae bacterium]